MNRYHGLYGPTNVAGEGYFLFPETPAYGLLIRGDLCFLGIGVPDTGSKLCFVGLGQKAVGAS